MQKYLKEVTRFKKTKSPGALSFMLKTIFSEIKKETGWNYPRIASDFLSKRRKLRINLHEYYVYSLYNGKMPEQYLTKFTGRIARDSFLDRLNPLEYILLARNKYITKILLNSLNIPTPELLFLYDPQAGLESQFVINNPESAENKLLNFPNKPFVVKVLDGEHGKNINVYTSIESSADGTVAVHVNGERHTIPQLLNFIGKNQRLLFEVKLRQIATFDEINPTSINTIRMITLLHPNGEADLLMAFIRMGRKGRWVDNIGKGGNVIANVNKETGRFENIVSFVNYKSFSPLTHHPDSGVDLENFRIEDWDGVKKQVFDFHRKLSWLKAIGWDVAITDKGPVIIEINNRWDLIGQVISKVGWKDQLNDVYREWGEFENLK